MKIDAHPEIDSLKAYMHSSDSPEFAELRLHLAVCSDCRNEITVLSTLSNNYAYLSEGVDENEVLSDEQQQLLMDYVDGKLSPEAISLAKSLIKDNRYAMKSVLHYGSHRSVMADSLAVQKDGANSAKKDSRASDQSSSLMQIFNRLMQWSDFQLPAWFAVPAMALSVAAIVFSIQSFLPGAEPASRLSIASYQDNPVMQFRSTEALPGIGFFDKANKFSRSYSDIQISVVDDGGDSTNRLKLHWPEVDNAAQYTMRLQVFKAGQKISLGEISGASTTATFDIDEISQNRRYEWVLSGETHDGKAFYSTGGFVISGKQ